VTTPEFDEVTIYADGASSGNPGPGGYGVVLLCQNHRKELSGGFKKTTNNRMELLGVITGLQALKRRCRVTVISDSKYVVDAVEKKWMVKWKSFGWRRNQKDLLLNSDLWKQLDEALGAHDVRFKWVPGHRGYRENERCDELAVGAAQKPNLPIDPGFETPSSGRV
jgi:ribonuclease HI